MKIIIDNKIPYINGVLEPYAEVVYLPGSQTTAEVVKDADALITRTRTLCNETVLRDSNVKFIATATIGFDHIDTEYCKAAGIEWVNAPGCNSESVNQYVSSALLSYAKHNGIELARKTIGVVGVGQVGSKVAKTCEILGMKVLLNDPPRERAEGSSKFVSLETIREQADMISFHVPLNRQGIDKTFHMADAGFIQNPGKKPLLINTCRGEIFDTEAVRRARVTGDISGLVIDCWENEPDINLDLLGRVDFGTAHIAGYSRDGKANGTKTSVQAISRFFKLGIDDWEPRDVAAPSNPVIDLDGRHRPQQAVLADAVLATYQIENDDKALRNGTHLFEQLRGDYPARREFAAYSIRTDGVDIETKVKLEKLGFSLLPG